MSAARFLALVPALLGLTLRAQEPAQEPAQEFSVILAYENGSTRRIDATSSLDPRAREGVRWAWIWGPENAPRRISAAQLSEPLSLLKVDTRRLRIQVPKLSRAQDASAASAELQARATVLAAPVRMWEEVPENLLPSWPLATSAGQPSYVEVPVVPGLAWRTRLIGPGASGFGSAWSDVPSGTSQVTLVPRSAADRAIAVLSPRDEPLPAWLTVQSPAERGGGIWAQYSSGQNGLVVLPGLPNTEVLRFLISAEDHASRILVATAAALPASVRLDAGVRISGRLVDGFGQPVAGGEVLAEAWMGGVVGALEQESAISDDAGRFELGGLSAGPIALVARARGFAPWRDQIEVAVAAKLGDVILERGVVLPVLVVDEQGGYVGGATVRASGGIETVTDARGEGALEGLALARTELSTEASGYLPKKLTLTPPFPSEARVMVTLAFQLAGRLVDSEGAQVQGGTVRVQTGARYRDSTLGLDGAFDLVVRPREAIELTLSSSSTAVLQIDVAPGEPGERRDLGDLVAPAGVRILGRLVSADDGLPVAGARVWCPRPSHQGEVVEWAVGNLLETHSDAQGLFALDGVPPQPLLLRADAPSYARKHLAVPVGEAAGTDGVPIDLGDVELVGGARLRVRAEGAPEGAVARVDLRNAWRELDMLSASVIGGEATVENVPPGRATVTVRDGRELWCEETITVPERTPEIELDCRDDERRVSGIVLLGEEPAPGGELQWQLDGLHEDPAIIINQTTANGLRGQRSYGGSGRDPVMVAVGADGQFTSERLRPGVWRVVFSPPGIGLLPEQVVEVAPADDEERSSEQTLILRFAALLVEGTVVDGDGEPVASARVEEVRQRALAISDEGGRFRIAGLEPGPITLLARDGALRSAPLESFLELDRAPDDLILVLEPARVREVQVDIEVERGVAASGALVLLEDDRGGRRLVSADTAGKARFPFDPPYPRRLRAAASFAGRWVLGPWIEFEEEEEPVVLELAFGETGSLLLESERLEGLVELRSANGWDLTTLQLRLGRAPRLRIGEPLHLSGLPEGTYELRLGSRMWVAAVRASEVEELELEGEL